MWRSWGPLTVAGRRINPLQDSGDIERDVVWDGRVLIAGFHFQQALTLMVVVASGFWVEGAGPTVAALMMMTREI